MSISKDCQAFVESLAVSAMTGIGAVIAQLPASSREAFIMQLAETLSDLAVTTHKKIHDKLSSINPTPPTATSGSPSAPSSPTRHFASPEYITFDEALKELNISESRLRRFVSEGEIRVFRENDAMKFQKEEIKRIAFRYRSR